MSMIMTLAALDRDLTAALIANPKASFEVIMDPAKDEMMASIGHPIQRVLGGFPKETLSLEKDWHILHFSLTKTAWGGEWPRSILISGEEIGDDIGYGPGKLITAEKAAEAYLKLSDLDLAAELEKMSDDDVVAAEIYSFSHGAPIEVWRDLAQTAFTNVLSFLKRARENDCSVFVSIC